MTREVKKQLVDALDARSRSGSAVQLWLRDDDAVEPTVALDRLLIMGNRYAIPMTLAVIPALSGSALAERLQSADSIDSVTVAVHGWAHQNYAPPGEKKQELGLHRPSSETLAELDRGYTELSLRHERQFVPLLVPPWNRIDPAIISGLPSIGFKGLSTFGSQSSNAISMMNAHVDVIDWKGSRGGRDLHELMTELVSLIESTRTPIGILTHHLVHDDKAWQFLEQLFSVTSTHKGAEWLSIDKLLPDLLPNP